ncbi:hypothetical protein ElyMa_003031100 [Elysia marginata]|uniref:Uncharacterized protein n=1 Tax=Elysia marginata TaxID=1093978 RepID=A0AAV4IGS6_9GAST|nr:hypothetical protein ElyMa_003031100 [Elysia marginata]
MSLQTPPKPLEASVKGSNKLPKRQMLKVTFDQMLTSDFYGRLQQDPTPNYTTAFFKATNIFHRRKVQRKTSHNYASIVLNSDLSRLDNNEVLLRNQYDLNNLSNIAQQKDNTGT